MRAVENGNSEGKYGTAKVELQSHEKSKGGIPSPHYYPQAPLPILSLFLLLSYLARMYKKVTPRLNGGTKTMLTNLIYFYEHYNGLVFYFITNSYLPLACFSVGFLYILVQKLIFYFDPSPSIN